MILQRGEILFLQGETGDLFHLKKGLLKIVRSQEDGQAFLFNILIPGEIFPHHSLISPTAYYGTAIALTECEVEWIPAQKWYQELENDPRKYRDVALLLQNTLRKVQKRVEMTTVAKPLRIPMFQEWISQFVPDISLLDLLTQEEIGQFLGMSRETVNRYFRKMEKEHSPTCRKKGENGMKG